MDTKLTRRQQEIYDYLKECELQFPHPPTLAELCNAMGLSSRGSMHKQVQALIEAGLVEPMDNKKRGIRLVDTGSQVESADDQLPMLGYIAAGRPIEAISGTEQITVPSELRTSGNCYVLQVKGDSMIEEGIFDGDWVVIEQRSHARNGEIVVALVDGGEATLKRIQQTPRAVVLYPANSSMEPMSYPPDMVEIQGILVGQMRRYH